MNPDKDIWDCCAGHPEAQAQLNRIIEAVRALVKTLDDVADIEPQGCWPENVSDTAFDAMTLAQALPFKVRI